MRSSGCAQFLRQFDERGVQLLPARLGQQDRVTPGPAVEVGRIVARQVAYLSCVPFRPVR